MTYLKKALLGEYSLAFTFWVLGFVAPTPIFATKYYLKESGVLASEDMLVFAAGRVFLWVEWLYFAFITVALWNAASAHVARAAGGAGGQVFWGRLCQALAIASGVLALGSFANLSGLTELLFGRALYIGLGAG